MWPSTVLSLLHDIFVWILFYTYVYIRNHVRICMYVYIYIYMYIYVYKAYIERRCCVVNLSIDRTCGTWLIHVWDMTLVAKSKKKNCCRLRVWDMAYSHVRHDAFTSEIQLIHYNTQQHLTTHCNTLQHTATHCNTLQHTATPCHTPQRMRRHSGVFGNSLPLTRSHTRTRTNTHTHTHSGVYWKGAWTALSDFFKIEGGQDEYIGTEQQGCNTLQHTATHCNALQCSAMHCNALQHTAT